MLAARIAGTHQRQDRRGRAPAGSRRSRPPATTTPLPLPTGANLMAATPLARIAREGSGPGPDIWARPALDMGTAWGDAMLVSEKIGQFFVASDSGRDRLEYTEYGAGDAWVGAACRADTPPDAAARWHALAAEGTARGHPRPARARPLGPPDDRTPTR